MSPDASSTRLEGGCEILLSRITLSMSTGDVDSGDADAVSATRCRRGRVIRIHRVLTIALAVAITTVFCIAARLSPDERGFGTHEQLGLPACQFRTLTGWNCPHCGMTTSFSHFVRGQWVRAFRVNASGLVLALISVSVAIWGLTVGLTGYWFGPHDPMAVLIRGIMWYLVLTLVLWVVQLIPGPLSYLR
jgi:hypothetical protein